MPEMTVVVRWPDGALQRCYSPSLVMHDHLEVDGAYTVADFRDRSTRALAEASERVRAKYGFACTSAAETTAAIDRSARRYAPDAVVRVVSMQPPLPKEAAS